jgi:hypothetical protein
MKNIVAISERIRGVSGADQRLRALFTTELLQSQQAIT